MVTPNEVEAEGMTFLLKDGVPCLYVLDYNKAVAIFLREYTLGQ